MRRKHDLTLQSTRKFALRVREREAQPECSTRSIQNALDDHDLRRIFSVDEWHALSLSKQSSDERFVVRRAEVQDYDAIYDCVEEAIIADGGNLELSSVDRVSEARNESAPPTACCTRKTGPAPHTQYARL